MTYDKIYFPYPSTDTIKKFFTITNQGKKVRFGAKSCDHFTGGHLDKERKERYLTQKEKKTGKTQTLLDIGLPNSCGYILVIKKVMKK